ncbi:hypothetical protein L1049_021918 [Liquidambar formosana]|uniref:Uncharacterized protein n=1 Tax=Liquidambar formosana TaxID=63359 RepID=A0AAP0RCU2_LIQFO
MRATVPTALAGGRDDSHRTGRDERERVEEEREMAMGCNLIFEMQDFILARLLLQNGILSGSNPNYQQTAFSLLTFPSSPICNR